MFKTYLDAGFALSGAICYCASGASITCSSIIPASCNTVSRRLISARNSSAVASWIIRIAGELRAIPTGSEDITGEKMVRAVSAHCCPSHAALPARRLLKER